MADPVEKDYGPKSDEAKYSHTHQHEVLAAGGADDEDFAFTFGKFMACVVGFSLYLSIDVCLVVPPQPELGITRALELLTTVTLFMF